MPVAPLTVQPDMECSMWLDGWPTWLGGTGHEWLPCCQAHDLAPQTVQSALELGQCVARIDPSMGVVMALGVILLGPLYLAIKRTRTR